MTQTPIPAAASRSKTVPLPSNQTALRALKAMIRDRSPMSALEVFHAEVGTIFRAGLPGFRPIMLAGAEAARFILVEHRDDFVWRMESDPITRLLRHGLLVEDGESHDSMRRLMNPALHRQMFERYVEAMWRSVDQEAIHWGKHSADQPVEMLEGMRRIAMRIVMDTLFSEDCGPDLDRLWESLLKMLRYISPGAWLVWRNVPRPGFKRHLDTVDHYMRKIIATRRAQLASTVDQSDDLLSILINADVDDDMIRDQMATMIVAGHDTSTAGLAWALHLLGQYPDAMRRARDEVDGILAGSPPSMARLSELRYLNRVIDETLRLYPPAHLGSRVSLRELEFGGYTIPAGERVTYSIYVTHRMPEYWDQPHVFDPDRFLPERSKERPPYSFIPFGGGPRNCIGASFAQVEMKVVLARLLQRYDLSLVAEMARKVRTHMAVTLEPRPGVFMRLFRR